MDFLLNLVREGATVIAPTAAALVAVLLVLAVIGRVLERRRLHSGAPRVASQFVMGVLYFLGLLVIILVLPVTDATRGQLYTLLGIVVSASLALSSTTILGNAIAGLQIRFIGGHNLRIGDYVRVEGQVGRVTEMGILATVIQTETRDLTALPNLWIVARPATVVQRSGTIVSTTVTLGYDVPHPKATAAMLEAAERIGLSNPFVRIEALGNFSVSYKVAGVLTDVMRLLETFSQLRKSVLNSLHAAGIEIVSPNLMSSRAFSPTKKFVPEPSSETDSYEPIRGDEIVFDEASAAAERENQRETIRKTLKEANARRDAALNPVKRKALTAEVARLEKKLESLGD